jgi:putative heme transporter
VTSAGPDPDAPSVPGASADPASGLDEAGLPKDRPRGVGRRILSGFLTYGVVVLCVVFLVRSVQGEDFTSAVALITATQVVVICLLGVVNLATNLPPMAICLPGLRYREAAVTNTASAALSNTVPEGGAIATGLNYAMLRSWGFTLSDITSEVVVTGTWSQMTKYTLLAVGLVGAWYQGWGPPGLGWVALIWSALAVVAAVLLALILRSTAFAVRLGRWTDALLRLVTRILHSWTPPVMERQVPDFRELMVRLLRFCWGRLTVAMVVSQLTACLVLGVALRMQGLDESEVSWAVVVLAYGAVVMASLLVPTPGGLGVAELVLTLVLGYGLPESDQAAVLAAVLLYRIATFLVPIPIGLVTYLYWRRSTAWRRPVDSRPVVLPGDAAPVAA